MGYPNWNGSPLCRRTFARAQSLPSMSPPKSIADPDRYTFAHSHHITFLT